MREEIIKIYQFNELSESAQKLAIEKMSQLEYKSLDLEFWSENWEEMIKTDFNFNDVKIHYSLGYCQGDGASLEFSNTQISELKFTDKRMASIRDSIWDFINHIYSIESLSKGNIKCIMEDLRDTTICTYKNSYGNHYSHNRTIESEVINFSDYDFYKYRATEDMEISEETQKMLLHYIDIFCENIEYQVTEFLQNIGKELERSGYEEIEYRTGEEYTKENIISNEYEFTENGEIYQ